jgi:uncharacterized protein
MGHRHSPEESGRAERVCGGDGGVAAAGAGREAGLTGDFVDEYRDAINRPSAAESRRDSATLTAQQKPCPPVTQTAKPVPPSVRWALFALRFYKAYLSMLFAGSCRFQPTCSQYSYEAVERFGLARGAWLTLKRLARCQPLSRKFGIDPVPEHWPVAENWEESEDLGRDVGHSAGARHEVHT